MLKAKNIVHFFKRNFSDIVVSKNHEGSDYCLKLKGITIKTPKKNILKLPNESLAHAIANEFKCFKHMSRMHLTSLAFTAIDDPFQETKESISSLMLDYLKFDTIRYRDPEQEDLLALSSEKWDPIIGWFEEKFNVKVPIDYNNFGESSLLPQESQETVRKNLLSLDRWPLIAMKYMTSNLKSFILTTSLTEQYLSVHQTVDLARLETKFQIQRWPKVEEEHDLDDKTMCSRVAAGTLFYHLSL